MDVDFLKFFLGCFCFYPGREQAGPYDFPLFMKGRGELIGAIEMVALRFFVIF